VDDRTLAQYFGILPPQQDQGQPILELTAKDAVLSLTAGHNVTFEFVAFDFSAPENVEYRHRLLDIESDWSDSDTFRSVTYAQLGGGKYTFQVTACNGDGDWNQNPTSIGLDVAPFLWERWWFRLAAVALFTFCVIAIVRYVSFRRLRAQLRVLEQQAALQRERARIAKDIHDDLGANLTQIAYLGELANQDRGEPNLVGERIGKISATARQTVKSLDEIVWAVNPRNDTLAHLLDYAGQFTLDYLRTVGIRCRLDFPTEVPQRELSTDLRHNLFLVIKEALHNIFKHANATEVWLRAAVNEEALEMVIEDNGRGFASAPDDALADGLRNMKQRMTEIGGSYRVESQPGSGTKIILRLPWPKTE
jgi:signal transduction histidine kinase